MDRLAAGFVRSSHGVRGELSVRCYTGSGAHLQGLVQIVLEKNGAQRSYRVLSARSRTDVLLLSLEGVDTKEAAQDLAGSIVWVDRKDAAPLSKDEYYEADLCRCRVYVEEKLIGSVRSVIEAGSSQLLEVVGEGGPDILVPFIDHFILDVDVEKRRISLRGDELLR